MNKVGFIHPFRQSGVVLHSSYSYVASEQKWIGGERRVLWLPEDFGGAAAISYPWASVEGAGSMIQRMAEFMKKSPRKTN